MNQSRFVSVMDRLRALDIEITNELSWACGDAVRDAYEKATGSPPVKGLRTKTCGRGSHCFALYPQEFVPEIDRQILRVSASMQAEARKQMSLFASRFGLEGRDAD